MSMGAFTEFTIRLFLIFFPGIICALLVEQLAIHEKWSSFRFLIYAFVLGMACYILYAGLLLTTCWSATKFCGDCASCAKTDPVFLGSLNSSTAIDYREIFFTTLISVPLAFLLSAASTRTWLHRAGRKLRVTKRSGDIDVWAFLFNSDDVPSWVVVRDIEKDLAYEGWVELFSASSDPNELFIRDVRVLRDSTREELYTVGGLYLAQPKDKLKIEFTGIVYTGGH